jgi:hypothetical protein
VPKKVSKEVASFVGYSSSNPIEREREAKNILYEDNMFSSDYDHPRLERKTSKKGIKKRNLDALYAS